MVEIEQVLDDAPAEEAASESNTTPDGWERLMGDDLVMKVRLSKYSGCPLQV